MNAIPHQIRVVWFGRRRTVNAVPDDMPHHICRTLQPLGFLPKTHGGGAEPRYASLFGQSCDLRCVLVAGGQRFVNKTGFLAAHTGFTCSRWVRPSTLSKSAADRACRYINNAPPEVDTPLRRQCRKLVGCNLVPTWFQRRAAKPAFFRYKRCRFNGFEVC